MEYEYSAVTADGTTIDFTPPVDGPPAVVLPQHRVFSCDYGCACAARSAPSSSGGFWPGAVSTSSRRRTAPASPRVESSWECVGSAQRRDALAGDPSLRTRCESKIRQSVEQDAQRRGQFGKREPISDAAVRALAETDEGRGSAGDVEYVGLGIDRGSRLAALIANSIGVCAGMSMPCQVTASGQTRGNMPTGASQRRPSRSPTASARRDPSAVAPSDRGGSAGPREHCPSRAWWCQRRPDRATGRTTTPARRRVARLHRWWP